MTGADITPAYVEDAIKTAREQALDAAFILSDIRDVHFHEEFDVALNLDDGAIGYLENDAENLKIFDVVARALKPGGKHFMGVNNAACAERCFPTIECEIGEKMLTLWSYGWYTDTRIMTLTAHNIPYGEPARKPKFDIENAHPIRLYDLPELEAIFRQRGMRVAASYANYTDKASHDKELVLNVHSIKEG